MKTSFIEIDSNTTVYIINNFNYFAKVNGEIEPSKLSNLQSIIEKKLESEILMVRIDPILNVIEFYLIATKSQDSLE